MLEYLDNISQKDDFKCSGAMERALILCEVLKEADVRRATPYIAYRYGDEFKTGWYKNHHLVKKFYRTHMPELYAYISYKLNKILEYLIESIPTLVKQPTIRVDQAVIESLNRLTNELTRSDSATLELEGTLTSTIDDIISGKPCIRRPILQDFELLNQIVEGNAEINSNIRISKNGTARYNTYAFSSKLASICLDVMKKIQNKQGLCPAYRNWGILLGALYKLHAPWEWLYEHSHDKFYMIDHDTDQRLVPYCNMELEEVLVDPKEFVRVTYDDDLYKLMECKHTANRPDNELIRAYVNRFYTVIDTSQTSVTE
jgi:hypothetical protein